MSQIKIVALIACAAVMCALMYSSNTVAPKDPFRIARSSTAVLEHSRPNGNNLTTRGNNSDQAHIHVLFLGDSVTRYSYLTLAHFLHTGNSSVPQFMIQDRISRHWAHYFRRTTEFFEGSMSCDCFRMVRNPKCSRQMRLECGKVWAYTAHENRQYRHPRLPLFLTFMQVWGDIPMFSTLEPERLHQGTITEALRNYSWKKNISSVLEAIVPRLVPPITHTVLNIGIWQHSESLMALEHILAALSNSSRYTLWRETTPAMNDRFNNTADVDWKAKSLCAPAGNLRCEYFPFPVSIKSMQDSDWWDSTHFSAGMNERWTGALWNKLLSMSNTPQDVPRYPLPT